jgi:hypothetical protein
MPLELGIWRIDGSLQRVDQSSLDLESRLEDLLDKDISIANPGWMVVGRQIDTGFGGRVDLLAIDEAGNLVLLELKRDQTPRQVVSQVLEYGAWVRDLRSEDIAQLYQSYIERYQKDKKKQSFDQAYCQRFGVKTLPEELNTEHELVVVASQFDLHSERIVTYLSEQHEVAINAIFFRVFKDQNREYLTRVWMRDPSEHEVETDRREKAEWNGEYYVSFGGGRDWEEARKYGFISGGGGLFYSQTLALLSPNDRVWVNIPGGTGYVGVGHVVDAVVPVEQFMVSGPKGKRVPITSIPGLRIAKGGKSTTNPETGEYVVRVKWLKTVPSSEAIKERGFFGVQHTVARPKNPKWVHTVERLKQRFGIKD